MRFLLYLLPSLLCAQTYDVVLQHGRVMDPESGLDAVRSVGIADGKIVAISANPLRGKTEVDAAGLVIAPGFIDIHQHSQTLETAGYKAMDGVTTALELEVGVSPVSEWYAARAGKSLINYGASSGHIPARMRVMHDSGEFLPRDAANTRAATSEEQKAIEAAVKKGLDEGGLGMGMGITYTPTASPTEILNLFYLAAQFKRPIFVHLRATGDVVRSLQEVIADAAASGASLHVVHLNSAAMRQTPDALRMVEGARLHGLDITTESYPYIAGATRLESALFDPGWQQRQHIDYGDLMWPATGERLNPELFERYRKQGGTVIMFSNTEEMIRLILTRPQILIASDGILDAGVGHPRAAGTYARLLGKYVRDEKVLTLMDAIRKSSLLPAMRLQPFTPAMLQKGRVKIGADADLAVFDPNTVIDKATFEKPAQYSEGFRYVLVGGTFVVRDGKLQSDARPGQGIRAR